jgi:hypothetical protein
MFYAVCITAASELLLQLTKSSEALDAVQIEVLLPAFVLGCCVRTANADRELQEEREIELEQQKKKERAIEGDVSRRFESAGGKLQKKELETTLKQLRMRRSAIREKMESLREDVVTIEDYHKTCNVEAPALPHVEEEVDPVAEEREQSVATAVSFTFMVLVGLTMPSMFASDASSLDEPLSGEAIIFHVFVVSVFMVLGKMFPVLCYRDEASWLERFALCMGMCPRGEVGAGIIVISLDLGISGPAVTIAMLCLAVNLTLSGGFVGVVKLLLRRVVAADALLQLQGPAQDGDGKAHTAQLDERRQHMLRHMQIFCHDYYRSDEKLFETDIKWLLGVQREIVLGGNCHSPTTGPGFSKAEYNTAMAV